MPPGLTPSISNGKSQKMVLVTISLQYRKSMCKSFQEISILILTGKASNSNINDTLTPAQLACSISNIKTHTFQKQ